MYYLPHLIKFHLDENGNAIFEEINGDYVKNNEEKVNLIYYGSPIIFKGELYLRYNNDYGDFLVKYTP